MSFTRLLRTLERITRPPRMGHDVDVPCVPAAVSSPPGKPAAGHLTWTPTSQLLTSAAQCLETAQRYDPRQSYAAIICELYERAAIFSPVDGRK